MIDFTIAPLPKWINIVKAIINKPLSLDKLASGWMGKKDKGYWFSRTTWSIYLIIKFRLLTSDKNNINVWLPDYFCNEATTAIRSLSVKLSFYPILSNGMPDLKNCNKILKDHAPDVILYVNYFGEPLFCEGLSNLAKKNKAWLIEDSVHCLKPESKIGNHGDFVIYSPHKFLSIPDGAILVTRNTGPNKLTNEFLECSGFETIYYSLINEGKPSKLAPLKWLSKRLIQKMGLQLLHKRQVFNNNIDIININKLPHPKMSKVAQKLLSIMFNLESEAIHRKKIQMNWNESINANISLKNLIIKQTKIKYTPYLAKINLSKNTAENIFNFFENSKIPVSTWPDLPPEVLEEPELHKVAIKLRLSCIFLPVHGSINSKKLRSKIRRI